MKTLNKIIKFVLIFNILIVLYVPTSLYIADNKPKMAYISHEEDTCYKVIKIDFKLPQKQYKWLIRDVCKTPHLYFEVENINETTYAQTSITILSVFINKSKCDNNLELYIWAYTHELMHIKYYTTDERSTNCYAFITLYESGNDELKQVALNQFAIMKQYDNKNYDCSYQIQQYLKQQNVSVYI